MRSFAHAFAQQVSPALGAPQVDALVWELMASPMAVVPLQPRRPASLRLVLRHDCQ